MSPTPSIYHGSHLIRSGSLDPEAFAPFGQVIQNPATHGGRPQSLRKELANQGSATKWLDVTGMVNHYGMSASGKAARVVFNMFVCKPRELIKRGNGQEVFEVKILERHPFTPQTFVPVGISPGDGNTRYLVIVAPTLPVQSGRRGDGLQPAYPIPDPRRKRSLRERLLGARPNPFTNDFTSSTTPPASGADTIVTKPKGPGPPDLSNIKAFIARGDQAVTYGPGTWHAPMVVLGDKPIDFVVVQYGNGVGMEDCQEVEIKVESGDGIAIAVSGNGGQGAVKAKL